MKAKAKKTGKIVNQIFFKKNKIYEFFKPFVPGTLVLFEVVDEIGVTSAGGVHTMSYSFFNEYFTEIS